jgi:hypothetical protein
MQVDFYFAPTGVTMLSEAIKQIPVVLLGWVEISMPKGKPIMIAPFPHRSWVFSAPTFQPSFLHVLLGVASQGVRDVRRLEVVRQGNDQMNRSVNDWAPG